MYPVWGMKTITILLKKLKIANNYYIINKKMRW